MSDTRGEPASAPDASASPAQPASHFLFVRIPFVICGVIVLAAILINICNVVGRYVFNAPVPWAEEAMSYMIIWGVFIAAGAITYQGLHLRMDLLVMNLRGLGARLLGALTVLLIVVCSLFVMRQSLRILELYAMTGETSMGARIPLIYPHAALLVGFFLMAAAAIVRWRSYWTGRFD
jgi:TRAP-type C4-dicarboxylate transport system permease small subunit